MGGKGENCKVNFTNCRQAVEVPDFFYKDGFDKNQLKKSEENLTIFKKKSPSWY